VNIECGEHQSIGMTRQRRPVVEDDVGGGVEGEQRQALRAQQAAFMKRHEIALGSVRV
jgi:hypothetical protein